MKEWYDGKENERNNVTGDILRKKSIRKQGSCTGLVSKSESPNSPKYRESRKSKNLRQMHGLNV